MTADALNPLAIGASLFLRDNARLRRELAETRARLRRLEFERWASGDEPVRVAPGQIWKDLDNVNGVCFYKVVQVRNRVAQLRRCISNGSYPDEEAPIVRIATAKLRRHVRGWELMGEVG